MLIKRRRRIALNKIKKELAVKYNGLCSIRYGRPLLQLNSATLRAIVHIQCIAQRKHYISSTWCTSNGLLYSSLSTSSQCLQIKTIK